MSRYLLKRGSDRVLPWTKRLASRPDMLECDAEGNIHQAAFGSKEDQSEAIAHLKAENSKLDAENEALRKVIQDRDDTIQDLNARLGSMGVGIQAPSGGDIPPSQNTDEPPKPTPVADGLDKVVEAIAMLEPDNKEHFTTQGLPRVEALEELLDMDIDMETRDQAWELHQKKAA